MIDPHQLSFAEFFWVGLLVVLLGREIVAARASTRYIEIFKPTVILAVVLAYYVLVGPLWALATGEWFDRGIDRRADMLIGWAGAAVFYFSTLVGFYRLSAPRFKRRLLPRNDPQRLYRLGIRLCQAGLLLFSVVVGVRVVYLFNPFTAGTQLAGSGLNVFGGEGIATYFLSALNLLIPGVCLLFATWVQIRQHLIPFLLWLLVAIGIFTSLGFRFRLVLLAVPLLIIWYLVRHRRPRFAVLAALTAALIFMAGYVGLTRSYGRGLDTAPLEDMTGGEIFMEGFAEAHVFLTTGGMMAATPSRIPYVGVQPLLSVLQFPIPRAFFPQKDTFGYLERSIQNLFGDPLLGLGSAVLCYGEWFLMAGWFSLVAMSLAFGWSLNCLWNWLLVRQHEPLAISCYAVAVSYLYLVVSRGYMAQVIAGAIFTTVPLFWIYYRWAKPVARRAAPSLVPTPLPLR